jgi:exodeoxyribonuclease-3
MRIATWNINGLRARIDYLLRWLDARQPDIVGLQELKLTDEQFPHDTLEAAGYHALTHGQKAWNGVAILSRQPATITQAGLPGHEDLGARLISAEIEGVSFTTVYCPNGKHTEHQDFPRKLGWFDGLIAHLDERHSPERPGVLCGDFNICPAPIDSCDEEGKAGTIFHTQDERSRFQQLLASGMHDIYREQHPDIKAFSWWDYRAGAFHRNRGLRIDMLLATPPLMARVRSVEIDRDYRKKKDGLTPSDHAPVLADLD